MRIILKKFYLIGILTEEFEKGLSIKARIAILGSEGQIGRSLCQKLSNDFKIDHIDLLISPDHDLRDENLKPEIEESLKTSDYIIFLAFDVGGARYLSAKQSEYDFLYNNTRLMLNVFSFLSKHNKKFIFASSEMALEINSPYGVLKALGEDFTKSLGGVFTRFWNVYDYEFNKEKSHVVTDFIDQALDRGVIHMLTDGSEERQFLHSKDCAEAIKVIIDGYRFFSDFDGIDISSFQTISIGEVAEIVSKLTNASIVKGALNDLTRYEKIRLPREDFLKFWKPTISLESGIDLVVKEAKKERSI